MQTKLKICSDCGKPSVLWKSNPKLCKNCAGKVKAQEQGGNRISRLPKQLTEEEKHHKDLVNAMFKGQALIMPINCMNCKKPLRAVKEFAKRCVTAHILPKAEFPEIASEKLNTFFLGAALIGVCSCHDDWDRKGKQYRTTMKIYPEAIERFETELQKCLNDRQFIKACDYLSLDYRNIKRK